MMMTTMMMRVVAREGEYVRPLNGCTFLPASFVSAYIVLFPQLTIFCRRIYHRVVIFGPVGEQWWLRRREKEKALPVVVMEGEYMMVRRFAIRQDWCGWLVAYMDVAFSHVPRCCCLLLL